MERCDDFYCKKRYSTQQPSSPQKSNTEQKIQFNSRGQVSYQYIPAPPPQQYVQPLQQSV